MSLPWPLLCEAEQLPKALNTFASTILIQRIHGASANASLLQFLQSGFEPLAACEHGRK